MNHGMKQPIADSHRFCVLFPVSFFLLFSLPSFHAPFSSLPFFLRLGLPPPCRTSPLFFCPSSLYFFCIFLVWLGPNQDPRRTIRGTR